MERCCQSQLIAEAAVKGVDNLKVIDHETAKDTNQIVGHPRAGWFMAQPVFDLVAEEMSRKAKL